MTIFGFEIELSAIVLGLITGMTYGLMAVGIVIVYRATRVINFAHGQMGAFAAAAMMILLDRAPVPYWVGFAFALALGAGVGAGTELLVVRRLAKVPLVMTIVATAGLATFLSALGGALATPRLGLVFPTPPGFPELDVGSLTVSPASSAILILSPLVAGGLAIFFRRSIYGLAIRASAANPMSAEFAGVSPKRMATLAWGLAGAVSAMTAVLLLPSRGFAGASAFGPTLLLRALVGAVLGRMTSLPVALAGGIGVGVLEGLLRWNYPQGGPTEMILFIALLVGLLFMRPEEGRRQTQSHENVMPWRPLPHVLRSVASIRHLGTGVAVATGAVLLAVTPFATNRTANILTGVVVFSLIGMSIVLLTGGGGQVSLGQFGLAAVGALVAFKLTDATQNYFLGLLGAGVAAAAASVLVGLPALRIRGLMLAVSTLAFALASEQWLLGEEWAFGAGVRPLRPGIGDFRLESSRSYYLFALAVFGVAVLIAHNYRRSGLGRQLVAVRDNEEAARSFTVPATRVKLIASAVAGLLAGLGGAVYVFSLSYVTGDAFPLDASVNVVALTALGGIGLLAGPLLGAMYIIAFPSFVRLDSAGLAATSLGWLLLLLYFPGGLAQLLRPLRESVVNWLARRGGIDPVAVRGERGAAGAGARVALAETGLAADDGARRGPSQRSLLQVSGLTKRFGALVAVDGATFDVREGEILGLIGPNGAGKTTLFEMISGFTAPDGGQIVFAGRDITRLPPEARGHLGVIRSFQDSTLFPTLTVQETLELACERVSPTRFAPAMLGLRGQDRSKEAAARELAGFLGLDSYRDHQIAELSTGTRRITELACIVALRPTLFLLDEPSSGIAQRETEALGGVLRRIKEHLDGTLVLIEHDMPLIMGLSDRIIAMSAGKVIAEGTPEQVQRHPDVVDSYLGGGGLPATGAETCVAITRAGTPCQRRAGADGWCGTHRRVTAGSVR